MPAQAQLHEANSVDSFPSPFPFTPLSPFPLLLGDPIL